MMMYKIKRFSILLDKLFSDLNKARTTFKNKSNLENLVGHFPLFMCTRSTTDSHWSNEEIPNFIFGLTKGYDGTKYINDFNYVDLAKFYKNDETRLKSLAISFFKKEYNKGGKNSFINVKKCTEFMNSDFLDAFTEFLTALDNIKKREKRVLKSNNDRYIISDILLNLRDRYVPED